MISNNVALDVLNAALSTGGDYAEIYCENALNRSLNLENGKVESSGNHQTYGAGIRILKGLQSVYGFTSDLSKESLIKLANDLAVRFDGKRILTVKEIEEQKNEDLHQITNRCIDVPTGEKIKYLKECYEECHSVDERLVRIITGMTDYYKDIVIFSAENEVGKKFTTKEERSRLYITAIANNEGNIETYFSAPGRCAGWDWFTKTIDYKKIARETGEKAMMLTTAKECPSGKYPVVIVNGWGGVIFHEACAHALEATSTAKGTSVFSKSIGKQIASPLISAYDDGAIATEWGSNSIDSEGHKTQCNELIKDGVCTGFLVDKFNGRRLKMEANGCSRRESFKYEPTSRMSNTYIAAGKDDPQDIIKDTKLGIYVANFGGGSVDPATGDFNFSASEAYIIRDGKVCEPVKGCTLIGTGAEVLMNIDKVGTDVELSNGGVCGSLSGMVPVNVGQPTIRIKEITVGGRGGKLE